MGQRVIVRSGAGEVLVWPRARARKLRVGPPARDGPSADDGFGCQRGRVATSRVRDGTWLGGEGRPLALVAPAGA
jgi:hypothetical protein